MMVISFALYYSIWIFIFEGSKFLPSAQQAANLHFDHCLYFGLSNPTRICQQMIFIIISIMN